MNKRRIVPAILSWWLAVSFFVQRYARQSNRWLWRRFPSLADLSTYFAHLIK
jgi:hypothetical protein